MAIIGRVTQLFDDKSIKASSIDSEYNNILTTLNNLDSATTSWTNVKTSNLIATGTTTNDNAVAGNLGEYVESVVSNVSFPASGSWGDLTSISLTAGDWDVAFNILVVLTGVTITPNSMSMGISQTAGNSSTGLVLGSNELNLDDASTAINPSGAIASYRQSLSATTTIYAKIIAGYSAGTPKGYGRLSARRVR